ncbi:peroxiredoxin [Pleurocapsales cyanobacterium LEGE 10410]|nr:peroxiredoxin [Pleurocapsales cyanobacterium LEGE 10410]
MKRLFLIQRPSLIQGWVVSQRIFHVRFWLAIALSLLLSWCTVSPAWAMGGKQPLLDQPAPEFTLPTNTGEGNIALQDYRGQWVVLYFYPKDFTSGCTLEARRFQQDLAEYEARNAQILGVSVDDVDSHREFCDSEGLKFPLLADTDGRISKTYGSWLGAMSLRHTYLIDPQGILRETFLGVRPSIHSQEVLARLDELNRELSG